MINLLESLNAWHWVSFGFLLLVGELLGVGGYLLWIGLGACGVGLLLWVGDIGWAWQWTLFAVQSVLYSWLWWKYQHRKDRQHDKVSTLNRRNQQYVGRRAQLVIDPNTGNASIRLDDTMWPVDIQGDYAEGDWVEVTGARGIRLQITRLQL